MAVQTVSLNKSHGGAQGVYKHASRQTQTDMTFRIGTMATIATEARVRPISP